LIPTPSANAGLGNPKGRQSSLTETGLSNRCANPKSSHRFKKARISTWLWPYRAVPLPRRMPCICAVAHMLAPAAQAATIVNSRGTHGAGRNRFRHVRGSSMDSGSMLCITLTGRWPQLNQPKMTHCGSPPPQRRLTEFGLALAVINGALLSTMFNQFAPSFRGLPMVRSEPRLDVAAFRGP
jgi:hypothetical protein